MTRTTRVARTALAIATACALAAPALAQEKVTVWFTKGFYKAEDDALYEVIKKYEAKNPGVKVDLSLYGTEDCNTKSVGAVDSGTPPDVGFCTTYDFRVTGKWAYEGKLEDVTDIIAPLSDKFLPTTTSTTYLYNDKAKRKAYYAMPIQRQTMHFNYWKDMLEEAGFKENQIPNTWNEFWGFWCDKVQPAYRKKTGKRIFAIGHPMGVAASDTFYSFLTFAAAHNAQIVDENGKIVLDQPKNRQAMINAVRDYSSIAEKGCTPPSSVNWLDPDHNVAYHNKQTIATHNATISIAAKWLDDAKNQSLTAEQRAQADKNYKENVRTIGFPKKPDGSTMTHLVAVKTAVVFAEGKNKRRGKEFLAFLMQDENLTPFVEGSLGRWYPVTKSGATRPFWTDGTDFHRAKVYGQFNEYTQPFQFVYNYKFTIVNSENVWAKAIQRVVNDKVKPEQATDEMIARIKQLAG